MKRKIISTITFCIKTLPTFLAAFVQGVMFEVMPRRRVERKDIIAAALSYEENKHKKLEGRS